VTSSSQPWYQAGVAGSLPELYERDLVPVFFAPWAEDLVGLAAPRAGEHVLDVACGTGVVARRAAPMVGASGRAGGVDLNAAMLSVARSLPAPPGASVEWWEGNATALPLPDAAFDVVFCQQGLQFFPDRSAALREMRRVLAPAGRLAVAVWRPIRCSPGFLALAEALARHVGAGLLDGPFSLGDAEELRTLVSGAGFRDVAIRAVAKTVRFPSAEEFVMHYVAASPLANPVAQAGNQARAALLEEVSAALRPYADDDGVAFPIDSHLALARA
jgi:SAM-dependent methyltransferase